jgi:thioredoxin-like negative regulator of GroEL
MRQRGYRSVTFLEGHSLRKRRKFDEAIPKLRHVVDNFRHNKAAVHELALCYRRQRRWKDLEQLLEEHGDAVSDSPIFIDFNISLKIARGDTDSLPAAIARLRAMDDNPTRADLRQAQLLQRMGKHGAAKDFLTHVLSQGGRSNLRLRSQRAFAAARSGDMKLAREDLNFLKAIPNTETRAANLEAHILLAEGKPRAALELVQPLTPQEPGDWILKATIMDAVAAHSDTGLSEASDLRRQATEIRTRYAGDPDFIFED